MQYMNIPFSQPDITQAEIDAVVKVMQSGWITTGPKSKEFEAKLAEYCGTNKVATMNSATSCMEMALRLLNIGPGDEVITTAYTYSSSASVIHHVGATIKLVDTAPNSFEMDYEQLAAMITPKTKAIIPVDIAGVMCDYTILFEVLEKKADLYKPKKNTLQEKFKRIVVIADAAHSLGALRDGKKSGQIADFTSFSFHAVKNLTTAEGGALTWLPINGIEDEVIYRQLMQLILHGQTKDALAKTKVGEWEYDIIAPYYKANMTDIHAAIGMSQLDRYPSMLERRYKIIALYNKMLEGLPLSILKHEGNGFKSSAHLYMIRLNDFTEGQRNTLIEQLSIYGISSNVHYKPLPMLTAYQNLGFDIRDYPNAYQMYCNEITLPLYSTLSDEEVEYIGRVLKKLILEKGDYQHEKSVNLGRCVSPI